MGLVLDNKCFNSISNNMLITVAEAKSFLQITGTTYDTLITGYCGYITAEINTYIGRIIESATYTNEVLEYESANFDLDENTPFDLASPQRTVQLRNYPVATVSGVVQASISYDGVALIPDDDYKIDVNNGTVYFYATPSDYQRKLLATYTAGYSTVPDDLKLVALMGVKDLFRSGGVTAQGDLDVTSKSVGDFSVNYSQVKNTKAYLEDNKGILSKYIKVGI